MSPTLGSGHSTGYQVLAVRTRPRQLSEVVGQKTVVSALHNMIASGTVPHACLFTGVRGTGKTSSARILAKSLCCEVGPTVEPCLKCAHCVHIERSCHEDVLEIDAASHTGVDNIRDLKELAFFYPSQARFRVFIIDEAHMLSSGAFNALLKTLEEPPPNVVFILATTEVHKIPLTVRSRCITFSFRKVNLEELATHLCTLAKGEGKPLEFNVAHEIARLANGSVRDALSYLEHLFSLHSDGVITLQEIQKLGGLDTTSIAKNYIENLKENQIDDALQALKQVEDEDLDWSQFLQTVLVEIRQKIVHTDDLSQKGFWLDAFRVLGSICQDLPRISLPLAWLEVGTCDILSRHSWFSSGNREQPTNNPLDETLGSESLTESPSQVRHDLSKEAVFPSPEEKPLSFSSSAGAQATLPKGSSNPIFQKFTEALSQIAKKSIVLSSRLRHANVLSLSPDLIVFDPSATNQLYCRCSAQEWPLFLEALEAAGFQQTRIQNFTVTGLNPPQIIGSQNMVSRLEPLSHKSESQKDISSTFFQGSSVASQETVARKVEEEALKNKILTEFPILKTLEQGGAKVRIEPKQSNP